MALRTFPLDFDSADPKVWVAEWCSENLPPVTISGHLALAGNRDAE